MRFSAKDIKDIEKPVNLSVKDKKLIQLLINDGRKGISELAKEVGISSSAIVQKIDSLREKGALVKEVVYTNVQLPINQNLFAYSIQTNLGMNNKEINEKLLSIPEISDLLWYNGTYNLVTSSVNTDPQVVIEKISEIIPINKIRVAKIKDGWFHPPRIFNEFKDVKTNFERTKPEVDELDIKILRVLENNARVSILELSKEVKSSVETIKKRLSNLKKNGAITGITTFINAPAFGLNLISLLFITKGRNNTDRLIKELLSFPQIGNVWEFEHEWNVNGIFWVKDQREINDILSQIYKNCEGILETEVMAVSRSTGK